MALPDVGSTPGGFTLPNQDGEDITLADYADRWRKVVAAGIKPNTLRSYEGCLDKHIIPVLGAVAIRRLIRGRIGDDGMIRATRVQS